MARPTVMTPDVITKLEESFAWGCSDIEACLWANISPATLYLYQDKNPEFSERKAQLKETPVLLARKTIVNAVEAGDKETSKWLIERRKKDEFSTKVENDITSGGEKLAPMLVKFVDDSNA